MAGVIAWTQSPEQCLPLHPVTGGFCPSRQKRQQCCIYFSRVRPPYPVWSGIPSPDFSCRASLDSFSPSLALHVSHSRIRCRGKCGQSVKERLALAFK